MGGGVFLDAGANHGLLSFGLAGRLADRVKFHLFEPNPKLVSSIKQSLALYPQMHCKINQMALSDREGTVTFLFDAEQSGTSHIVSGAAGEEVVSTTLDLYLERENIKRVDLLKIDVEGFELAVLRGAERHLQNQNIQAIYFEHFQITLRDYQHGGHFLLLAIV